MARRALGRSGMPTRLLAPQPPQSVRNVPLAVFLQRDTRDAEQDWQAETLADQPAVDQ